MNIVVHDYSGHPCQVHLSRELARRGHVVEHQYCDSYTTGRGATERRHDDPDTFSVRAIGMQSEFARYSPSRRLKQEIQYGRQAAAQIDQVHPDVAVLSNVPLLSLVVLTRALRKRKIPYVFWQQDIYSHAIKMVAVQRLGPLGRLVGGVATFSERLVARQAEAVVAISDTFTGPLREWKIPDAAVHVIPNWAAIDEMPERPADNPWARQHGFVDTPVVMYAGTLGLKHDPAILAALATGLPDGANVVVVSQGRGREWLESHAGAKPGLSLLDYQPYEDLPDMLATASVLIVLLESDASQYSVPSKVLNYLCAGRPVVAVLPADNAVAHMVSTAQAGAVVPPGDVDAATEAVSRLLADPELRIQQGKSARHFAEQTFDVEKVGDRFETLLAAATDGRRRA